MREKGYETLVEGAYYNESSELLVFDLLPRNAVQTVDGHIHPIDPIIQHITPYFGQLLRQEFVGHASDSRIKVSQFRKRSIKGRMAS